MSQPDASTVPAAPQRLTSLDGLRGVAAFVVLLHHSLLLVPILAAAQFVSRPVTGGPLGVLLYSPLHLLWGGTEAVYLFFVLSGAVLVHQVRRRGTFSWEAYYPSRMLRLYLPVAAAIALAAITIVIVPRVGGSGNQWLGIHLPTYTPATVLQDLTLIGGDSGVVTPLWSLQWEVIFSLMLPLAVLFARQSRGGILVAAGLAVLTVGFLLGQQPMAYLPMFFIGGILGWHLDAIHDVAARVARSRSRHLLWAALLVVAVVTTTSYWLLIPLGLSVDIQTWSRPLIVIGVSIFVIAALYWPPLAWLLSRRPFVWLGGISFSLYLVHEPIVVAFGYLLGPHLTSGLVAIVVALAVAIGFWAVVERPSHRLSRAVAARLAARPAVGGASARLGPGDVG